MKKAIFRFSSHKRVSNAPPFFSCSKLTCSIIHNDIFAYWSYSIETISSNFFFIANYEFIPNKLIANSKTEVKIQNTILIENIVVIICRW